jgi:predicted RND superfamily exporter protein
MGAEGRNMTPRHLRKYVPDQGDQSPEGARPIGGGSERDRREVKPARIFVAYVALAERHTGKILLSLLALMFVWLGFATRLELHTAIEELLPDQHPAVLALRRIAGRQKSGTNLVMLIHSDDPAANRRFAEALRPELEKTVPRLFTSIEWQPDNQVPDFARRWKWLYAEQKDLDNAEELLDRIIANRAQPGFVDLEGDPEVELKQLRERLNQKLPAAPVSDGPYFQGFIDRQHYLGVRLWRRNEGIGAAGTRQTMSDVQALVKRVNPSHFGTHIAVEYTGGIAQEIDELNGIREDVTWASVICLTCVFAAIYSYFRRVGLLLVIGAPAVLGVLGSLFIASLTIHYLNINTAFLITIILGNGINSPIIVLGRYGEERLAGKAVAPALAAALTASLAGVGAAVAAASVAYGCLLATGFRGFNQFGLLGGAGMLLVGVLTFVLVPPLVIFGERRWPGAFTPRPNLWRPLFAWIGRLSAERPRTLALGALLLTALAALPLYHWAQDPLEWNNDHLRTDDTPSQRLWPKMEALHMGGAASGAGNDGVLIVDEPEQADAVAAALKAQDEAKGAEHVIKEVRTLNSMVPKQQAEKLATLARIRSKIDRHMQALSADEQREVGEWRPPDYLRPVTVDDLPPKVSDLFTENDGHRGRLVGIDGDSSTYYGWDGHALERMSRALAVDALGKHWVAASTATVFAGILQTIRRDGPRVTLLALVGVAVLMVLIFGPRGVAPVLISIVVGVTWLGGLCGALNTVANDYPKLNESLRYVLFLKLHFMNFVALPITLGVGADYAANIWARLRADGPGQLRRVIAETGSAVALCSMTTIIGYSTLLISRNRALRSFGMLADLGEITCLVAALLVLPALVKLFYKKKAAVAH